jgi:chaperone modulatory protein CbpM
MTAKKLYKIEKVAEVFEVETSIIIQCVKQEWIVPANKETEEFDQEDIARLSLICELRKEFGVNDESVPIILHLLDQIHYLHQEIRKMKK